MKILPKRINHSMCFPPTIKTVKYAVQFLFEALSLFEHC